MAKESLSDIEIVRENEYLIRKMLFVDPLYRLKKPNEKEINILIIGSDDSALLFLDFSLQVCQIKDTMLHAYLLSEDSEKVQEKYFSARPALKNYVTVNNDQNKDSHPVYGEIGFFDSDSEDRNNVIGEIESIVDLEKVCYVFISTGIPQKNREIAEEFSAIKKDRELLFSIHYLGGERSSEIDYENGELASQCKRDAIDVELERMAFNTHMSWRGFSQIDIANEKKIFMEAYNFDSSYDFVLSLPYKLESVHISMKNISDAARSFSDAMKSDKWLSRELGIYEHRRWLIEKAVDGWQGLEKSKEGYDFTFTRSTGRDRDELRKIHPCMADAGLTSSLVEWSENQWDQSDDVSDLDELDRISVEMHRYFTKEASTLSASTIEVSSPFIKLSRLFSQQDKELISIYDHFVLCVKRIIDGSRGYADRYDDYSRRIQREVKQRAPELETQVNSLLNEIRLIIYPAIQRNLYRDLKQIDADLIEKIPFILTYEQPDSLVLCFSNLNEQDFNNSVSSIVSPTVVRPRKIVYFMKATSGTQSGILKNRVEAIRKYLDGQMIHSTITMSIAYLFQEGEKANRYNEIKKVMSELRAQHGTIGYSIKPCYSDKEVLDFFVEQVPKRENVYIDGSIPFMQSPKLNSEFIEKISAIPYFEYDRINKIIQNDQNCDKLQYIDNRAYVRVADLFALKGTVEKELYYSPYSKDYQVLKQIYLGEKTGLGFREAIKTWNALTSQVKGKKTRIINIVFPSSEYVAFERVLKSLASADIIDTLNISGTRASFSFTHERFRALLSNEGKMLELLTFYEACNTGFFDDAVGDYSFYWMATDAYNELDCILTRGFQVVVIECKDRKKVEPEYFHKLDSVATHLGTDTRRIMVLTRSKEPKDISDANILNSLRERAKAMNIEIVIGEQDIRNLGIRLVEISRRKVY